MEISEEWLTKRAEEELKKIEDKSISRLEFIFTSKEKIQENRVDAAKSLGKIEFIKEMLEQAKDKNK